MNIEVTGLFGLVLLLADIWAILNIVQSSTTTFRKMLWIVVILLLPLLGLLIWWVAGPRE